MIYPGCPKTISEVQSERYFTGMLHLFAGRNCLIGFKPAKSSVINRIRVIGVLFFGTILYCNSAFSQMNLAPEWEYIGHQGLYPKYNGSWSYAIGQGWINCIWVDSQNTSFILAGSHNSGIWKTTDGGDNWVSISDNCPGLKGVKSLEVDPADHRRIFAASCTLDNYSTGLYFTTDGGDTWTNLKVRITENGKDLYPNASKKNYPVKWIINPKNNKIMYLLTWTQLLMSKDGGHLWEIIIDKPEYNIYWWEQGFKDMEFDPSDPSVVYVSGIEIHKISGNGNKVSDLTNSILEGYIGTGDIKKIVMGTQAAFPGRIWFNIQSVQKNSRYFTLAEYNTGSKEVSWLGTSQVSQGAEHKIQCEVSPVDPGHIVLGGVSARFFDAGNTPEFYIISSRKAPENWMHDDVRDLVYLTDSTGREQIFVACDGSVFVATSTEPGKVWDWTYIGDDGANGILNGELKGFDCSGTEDDVIYAGFQDMNAAIGDNGSWYNVLAGDGSSGLVDPQNPDYIYASYFGSKAIVKKSSNRGIDFQTVITVANKVPAMAFEPGNTHRLYIGGKRQLFYFNDIRNNNDNRIILEIEEDPDPAPEGYYIAGKLDVNEIAVSPSDPKTIYISTDRYFPGWAQNIFCKAFFRSTDGGETWTDLSNTETGEGSEDLAKALKRGPVSGIAVHPLNSEEVWICLSGTSFDRSLGLVYRSVDGGQTWISASEGLEVAFPANDIRFNLINSELFLATDTGIWLFGSDNREWKDISGNLPPALIHHIRFNDALGKVRIGTYGRGIWQTQNTF